MFKQTLFATGLPVLPRALMQAVAVLTVFILFSWQLFGFISIQRGDFIDENQLRLRASSTQESGMGLEQVAGLHLFGDVATTIVEPPPPTDLPKTDLKLVLVGAMTDSDPQKASALIAADNQTRRFYVGDNIPGGAVLHEVLSDSVVLKRDGRYETLFFPKASEGGVLPGSRAGIGGPVGKQHPMGVTSSAQPERNAVQKDSQLRERLQRGPVLGRPSPKE